MAVQGTVLMRRLAEAVAQRLAIVNRLQAALEELEATKALLERQAATAALLVEQPGLLSAEIHIYHGLLKAPGTEE